MAEAAESTNESSSTGTNPTFASLVKQYLARLEWNQNDFAKALAVDKATISRYINTGEGRSQLAVVRIIACFAERKVLATVEQANELLAAADLDPLTIKSQEEAALLTLLTTQKPTAPVEGVEKQHERMSELRRKQIGVVPDPVVKQSATSRFLRFLSGTNRGIIVGFVAVLVALTVSLLWIVFALLPAQRGRPGSSMLTLAPGVWTKMGDMSDARYDHGITLLRNGKVLVATGRNVWDHDERLASSELYDPLTGAWSPTGNLNKPRIWFDNMVLLADGKVLIAGGASIEESDQFDTTELYDPSTSTWSYSGRLNVARGQPTLTLLEDGRVLCTGGGVGRPDANRFLNSAEVYDPSTGTWSYTGSMLTKREGHQAVRLHDGKVMVGGGEIPWKIFGDTAELYDPAIGKWSAAGQRPVPWRYGTLTVLADGRVLVAGGISAFGKGAITYANADLYDPKMGIWSPTSAMNVSRSGHTATLLPDGRVLIAGGISNGKTLSTCEIYDPKIGTWSATASLNTDRAAHQAVLLGNGAVLITGGWKDNPSSGALTATEIYMPISK